MTVSILVRAFYVTEVNTDLFGITTTPSIMACWLADNIDREVETIYIAVPEGKVLNEYPHIYMVEWFDEFCSEYKQTYHADFSDAAEVMHHRKDRRPTICTHSVCF